MIEAHTLDAWTRPAARTSTLFGDATILAGFAAPLFLWLAGVGAVLSATSASRRSGNRWNAVETVCRRGLELFILAFLFRLQAFIVSPGSHPIALFRVDVLNIMGPAVVAAGIIWGLCASPRALVGVYAGSACAVAMLTPVVRTMTAVDSLPTWVQWYVRPSGEYTTFTSFPWVGFVFAGAACGVLVVSASDSGAERRLHVWLAWLGLALLMFGLFAASRPSLYRQSSFWSSSPTYFAVRVGLIMTAFAALFGLTRSLDSMGLRLRALERLGQASLFVYWIHVELVYGYATWPIHRRLPLWGTALAFCAFTGAMYWAVVVRDRLVDAWRARRPLPSKAAADRSILGH
jgi:uncharacterized membrane protein